MKILILKVSAIGDVIHTLPAVFYLKKCCPDIQTADAQNSNIQTADVQISWVVQKKAADLILNQPFLDKVYVLPDKFLHPKNWIKTFKIVRELRQTNWDAIIDFQGIHKTSLLINMLKGIKFGFDSKLARSKFSTYFTHEHLTQEEASHAELKNIIQKNLALADFVVQALCKEPGSKAHSVCITQCPSITELKKSFTYKFDQASIDAVDKWLEANISKRARGEKSKFIMLCPNTTKASKHWPEEYWIEFIKTISQENLQHKILLVGQSFGQAAKNIAQACTEWINPWILNQVPSLRVKLRRARQDDKTGPKHLGQNLPIYIVPAWDLNTTAYLISKANLLIAPDTGLLHLADFLDTTTVGIFGPTSKELQGPFLKDLNIGNAIQVNDSTVTDGTNDSNLKKTTTCQNNMYKLTPSGLIKKVLHVLKNQN